jgi:tetratricopeptide (TPR) repeat protein
LKLMSRSLNVISLIVLTLSGCGQANVHSGQFDKYQQVLDLISKGKNQEVVDICNEKLKSSPEDSEFIAYRGSAESHLGQRAAGQADLQKAISINDKRAWYHNELASNYLDDGQPRKALESQEKALKCSTDKSVDANVHSGMACAYLRLDLPEKAVKEAGEALKIAPNQIYTYSTRAYAYCELFENDKALADANKMVELDPKNPSSYSTRATVYIVNGDTNAAVADVKKALALKPDHVPSKEILISAKIFTDDAKRGFEIV